MFFWSIIVYGHSYPYTWYMPHDTYHRYSMTSHTASNALSLFRRTNYILPTRHSSATYKQRRSLRYTGRSNFNVRLRPSLPDQVFLYLFKFIFPFVPLSLVQSHPLTLKYPLPKHLLVLPKHWIDSVTYPASCNDLSVFPCATRSIHNFL